MTKVFHLITTIERGGAENQLLILVREQIIQGFEVHIAFLKGSLELKSEFTSIGATVHSSLVGLSPFFQPFEFRKLLKGRKVIVHAHLPRAELVAALTPAKFKFVASRHNSEPFFPGAPRYISNVLSKLIEIRASKIIAISEAVRDFLISRGEVRTHHKIEVVHYGYRPVLTRNKIEPTSRFNNFHVGTISRLTDQKDISTMLKAFAKYRTRNKSAKLSILGKGRLLQNLEDLTRDLSIDGSVQFCGKSAEVIEFLRSLDVFILTSKYEGFGMVLLEAMDAGIPIIASRNSAIPEVLGNDFPGLCETGNEHDFAAKLELLQNAEFRKVFLDIQEERLGNFSAEKMIKKINYLYLS